MALTRNIAAANLAKIAGKENINLGIKNSMLNGRRVLTNHNKGLPLKTTNVIKKKEILAPVQKPAEVIKDEPQIEQSVSPMDISQCVPDIVEMQPPLLIEDIIDIDKDDEDMPFLMSEYIVDLYGYLRSIEKENSVKDNFLCEQKEVTSRMRAVLIDWMVQVHSRFHLLQETFFLTISILDRYLQMHQVLRKNLQLVGVTAMWIASKYEEMYAPEVGDFVYITDNGYDKETICRMERTICAELDFKFGSPLCIHFLRRFSKAAEADNYVHSMAKYFLELSVVDYETCHQYPSKLAAACLFLSPKKKKVPTATLR